ncbi:hypothetical protein HK101_002377, partial [Irineochytrium annulatum]
AETGTSVQATTLFTASSPDIYGNTWDFAATPRIRIDHPHRPLPVEFYLPGSDFRDVSVEHGIYKVIYRLVGGDGLECYVLNLGAVISNAELRKFAKRGREEEVEKPVRRRAITPVPFDDGRKPEERVEEDIIDENFWYEDEDDDKDVGEDQVLEDVDE